MPEAFKICDGLIVGPGLLIFCPFCVARAQGEEIRSPEEAEGVIDTVLLALANHGIGITEETVQSTEVVKRAIKETFYDVQR